MFEAAIRFRCVRMSSRNIWMSWSLATLGGATPLPGTLCGACELTTAKTAKIHYCAFFLL